MGSDVDQLPAELERWWDTVTGARVLAVAAIGLAALAAYWAVTDATGGRWLAAGTALLSAGMGLANLVHVRARQAASGPLRPPPGPPYDWTREPDPDAVISLTRHRRPEPRG